MRIYNNIKQSDYNIRIISYNILAPVTINGDHHKLSCSDECISWENRFKLIKKEVMDQDPDIITFQEAQTDKIYNYIFNYFNSKGYYGYYIPQKNPNSGIESDKKNFGVVILFKTKRFFSLKIGTIDFHKIGEEYLVKNNLIKFRDKIKKRYTSLVLKLKDKKTNKEFYVVTVHLESNPKYDDIKNFQGYITMKYINKLSNDDKIGVVLTGDFNSKPDSSNYVGITTGKSINKFDMEDFDYPRPFLNTPDIFTKYPLKSCYKEIIGHEPAYTNFTRNFKATLDYIFVNSNFNVLGVMQELSHKYIKNMKSVPDENFPSDHFMQVANIELN